MAERKIDGELYCNEGDRIILPERLRDYKTLRMPYMSKAVSKPNSFGQVAIKEWFRHKELGQKPFIPEGTIEIDHHLFKVIFQGCPSDADRAEDLCGRKKKEDGYVWTCTRKTGHEGFHHAHSPLGRCIRKWG